MMQPTEKSCSASRMRMFGAAAAAALAALAGGCDGAERDDANAQPTAQAPPAPQRADRPQEAPQATPVLGTFSANVPIDAGDDNRLPAPGDLTVYVPAVSLFPGSARIDPGIENPYSGDPEAVAAGERHFAAFNCAGCHAPLGGGGMGPPLSDDEWIHGSEPAQIYLTIMHGRPEGMPAWSSMLPRRTVWELVAYIETLSEIEDPTAELGFDSLEVRTSRTQSGASGASQSGQQ